MKLRFIKRRHVITPTPKSGQNRRSVARVTNARSGPSHQAHMHSRATSPEQKLNDETRLGYIANSFEPKDRAPLKP